MPLLTEPLPVTHLPVFDTTDDSDVVAMALYAIWAIRTGRTLRNAPISELTAEELEDFWADDQLWDHEGAVFPAG
ncbi:MAG TPA: hypothetical protein VH912_33750 [Streptosporangiaceae bacterium]|jgi:hypothetical protein